MPRLRALLDGGAQTLRVVVSGTDKRPEVPTSATYSIVDLRKLDTDSERTVQASTAATVDAYSEVLTAAAGPGSSDRRLLVVGDVTGRVRGQRLFVQADSGEGELVVVDRVDSTNSNLYLRDQLKRAYAATTTTVRGVEVSCVFPAAEADGEDGEDEVEEGGGPYALDVVAAGTTIAKRRWLIDLVRHDMPIYADVQDLLTLDQTLDTGARGLQAWIALEQAHRDFATDLRRHGIDPYYYDAGDLGRDAVTYRAAFHMRRKIRTPSDELETDFLGDRYDALIGSIGVGTDAPGVHEPSRLEDTAERGGSTTVRSKFRRA